MSHFYFASDDYGTAAFPYLSIPREFRTRSPFENVCGFGRALAGWRAEREAGQQPLALLPPAHLLPLGDGQAGADVLRVHAAVEAVKTPESPGQQGLKEALEQPDSIEAKNEVGDKIGKDALDATMEI